MSTISVEDHIRESLERNATARRLSLTDYLSWIAVTDAPPNLIDGKPKSLSEIINPIISDLEKSGNASQPVSPNLLNSKFDEAMAEKYRKMGFCI